MSREIQLSKRIQSIKPSPTMAITGKARNMKNEGLDVISFSAGEPDFDTPDNIKAAAKAAIDAGQTKYTPVPGTVELKKAIQSRLKKDHNLDYDLDQLIVSCGGKHSLYNIFQVIVDPGDEVIIPAPYWVSYPDQVILAEGRPVVVKTKEENQFLLTLEELSQAITSKTKAVILNSPNNPTGSAYPKAHLEKLVNLCVEKNIFIISDEIYEKVIFDNFEVVSPATFSKAAQDLTLLVNGVSKAYAMTGWRMGYTAGPQPIIAAMTKLQGQCTSGISSITQAACVEALQGPQDFLNTMLAAFDERRQFIVEKVNTISGLSCEKPQGAFYVFPNVQGLFGKRTSKGRVLNSCSDVCDWLLEDHLMACVPGEGFGLPGFMRISYATSMENIKKGLARLEEAVASLF